MSATKFAAGLLAAALISGAAFAGNVTVGYEAAGAQTTSVALSGKQVATFDTMSGWVGSGNIFTAGAVSGTITNGGFLVGDANVYGGAGGTGKFGTVYNTTTIQLSSAVTYAGLWASAIDGDFSTSAGNTVALYSGDTLVGSFALKPLLADASGAYWGNPNAPWAGQDWWEPFAFFNFTSDTAFDRIDLIQNGGGGFELDNVTIGNAINLHGGHGDNSTGAVPEPASWAMMLTGFGLVGGTMRARRRSVRFA
jgi:hypothetical protein